MQKKILRQSEVCKSDMLRSFRRIFIILTAIIILHHIYFFICGFGKKPAKLNVKLNFDANSRQAGTLDSPAQLPPTSLEETEDASFSSTSWTTASRECSFNYILSVMDYDNNRANLGNKMSAYASLIGHARRLKLRPYIVPSMKEALSAKFR